MADYTTLVLTAPVDAEGHAVAFDQRMPERLDIEVNGPAGAEALLVVEDSGMFRNEYNSATGATEIEDLFAVLAPHIVARPDAFLGHYQNPYEMHPVLLYWDADRGEIVRKRPDELTW